MTDGWVQIFDASGSWPTDPAACWADGYRAIAGYVNQGSWKSFTTTMRDRWITDAHPFAFAPMWEVQGDEPGTDPSVGTAHAHSARAGMRALFGTASDDVSIAYAEDRDITPGNASIAKYFALVKAADTAPPLAYVESDEGILLVKATEAAGVFEPAAYGWDNLHQAMTPATAPPGVLWTQEHNAVPLHGGSVDIGHIRTDAPIWWGDQDMPITAADVTTFLTTDNTGIVNPSYRADSPTHVPAPAKPNPEITLATAIESIAAEANAAHVNTTSIVGTLAGMVKTETAIQATLTTLAAGGTSVDTAALSAQIKTVGDAESAQVTALAAQVAALQTQNAALVAQVAKLEAAESAGASAEAAALKP